MDLNFCFPKELQAVKENRTPVVLVGGTVEYHGAHCAYGCDTLIAQGLLERLAQKKEICIAPPVYYSPSSYAVADQCSGTVHVEENAFEEYLYYVFRSMLYSGLRNIYVLIHHQFEQESCMPMTLCYMKAAKRATMQYLEQTRGQGWWGSEDSASYYDDLGGGDDPFSWIQVIPTMSTAVQNATGYDHAGKYETSLLMALYPNAVKMERLGDMKHWFTEAAKDAGAELGEEMARQALAYLEQRIK